jgi:hypothetical protein
MSSPDITARSDDGPLAFAVVDGTATRPDDVILRPASGVDTAILDDATLEVAIHDPRLDVVHRPNAAAGAVWLLCDGTQDLAAVAAEIAEIFGLDPTTASEDVRVAIDAFWDAGLLDGSPEPTGSQTPTLGTQVLPREPDP